MKELDKHNKFNQIPLLKPLKDVEEIFDNIKIIYHSKNGTIHKIIMEDPELKYEEQGKDLWVLTDEYRYLDIDNLTAYDGYRKLKGKVKLKVEWTLIRLDTIDLPYNA